MTTLSAFFLGILQGITEFLPVSSSGHLVLAQHFMHIEKQALLLDVWLHFGTLLAIFCVLYRPIGRLIDGAIQGIRHLFHQPVSFLRQPEGENTVLLLLVITASVPTALIGFFFKDLFEHLFEGNLSLLGVAFLFTAFLLLLTKFVQPDPRRSKGIGITVLQALAIGFIQGIAIIPGVSRSGSTIALALLLGVERQEAGEFSFLIVIPAIAGAMLLETLHGTSTLNHSGFLIPALVGMVTAWGVGIFALKALLRVVNHGTLYRFAYYCLLIGGLTLWIAR